MDDKVTSMLDDVSVYYSEKIAQFGATPQGVDWNSEESQVKRFEQLCRIIDIRKEACSINDLGCGYGALLAYLQNNHASCSYLGVDISLEMIKVAERRYAEFRQARFISSSKPDQIADYGIASGIFNVRLGRNDAEWSQYLQLTLDLINETSHYGFAFNCLTSYSDKDKMRDYLYYADPCQLFDLCKKRYSRQVALLHDYGLYEFTILVRKAP
jgi:SAM-dependent methyltransferase